MSPYAHDAFFPTLSISEVSNELRHSPFKPCRMMRKMPAAGSRRGYPRCDDCGMP
jgi:hypothetical protein